LNVVYILHKLLYKYWKHFSFGGKNKALVFTKHIRNKLPLIGVQIFAFLFLTTNKKL